MIETNKIYLIRHAPVKKIEGYVPTNDPNAIINPDHFKSLASHIPDNSICYVSPLKRAIQTAHQLSKFIKLLPLPLLKLSFKVIKNFQNELFPELFEPYIKVNGAIFKFELFLNDFIFLSERFVNIYKR